MEDLEALQQWHAVIFFDGVCNLCNSWVQFVIRRDPHNYFLFSSLQSGFASRTLGKFHINPSRLDSIMLLEKGKVYRRSAAALRILINLDGLWPLMGLLLLVPFFIRDLFYVILARNRYFLFGKKDACMIPTPETRAKFLE